MQAGKPRAARQPCVSALERATELCFHRALMRYPLALDHSVMAGLDPAIHVFLAAPQTWMPGTGLQPGRPKAGPGWPGMTEYVGQVERELLS
jgi:hypothetical protein